MTNYLDKDGLKKFWTITKGKYSPLGHTHDDRYLQLSNTSGNTSFSLSVKLNGSNDVDTGGGVFVEGYTGTAFKLWLHDTSNVWYKKTGNGAWAKMDAGKADKLSTARTIWGQSFNGSGNVDGAMTVNGTLHATGAATLDSTLAVKGDTAVENLTVNGVLTTRGNGVELYHNTPFIDFHYGNSESDYNVRIWNNVSGGLQINAPTLIDLVGPMKSSGGRLWITKGNTNIYDVTTSQLTSYVKAKHLLTSWFVGNVGIGTDADSAYKLKVNGKAYVSDDATVNGILIVNDEIRNGNFYTDTDGWVYTPHIVINDYDGLVIQDAKGAEYTFDVEKAKELGLLS